VPLFGRRHHRLLGKTLDCCLPRVLPWLVWVLSWHDEGNALMSKDKDAAKVAEVAAEQVGFGIDIGGSGIKGAPVHLRTGELLTKKFRLPTPAESSPDAVGAVLADVVAHFELPSIAHIGVTLPGIIKNGDSHSAANLDKRWIDTDVAAATRRWTGHSAYVVNDADSAGYAEVAYGAAKGKKGTVLVITLGTGIGSAMIHDGHL